MSFQEIINNSTAVPGRALPLVHIMDCYDFVNLASTIPATLVPQSCPVLKRDLVYFYYGRSAYRVNGNDGLKHGANAPIVLITESEGTVTPSAMYPLDTGAFQGGRFKGKFNSRSALKGLELAPNYDQARKLVGRFYGSNAKYVEGQCLAGLVFPDTEYDTKGYYSLISDESDDYDDRCQSIEIHLDGALQLNGKSLLGLIGPKHIIMNSDIASFLSKSGAKTYLYDIYLRTRASEYHALVRSKFDQALHDLKFL
jgi:hypothetical protein